MKYLPLIWANLTRHKTRIIFTLLSVIFAFLLFSVLVAMRQAFTLGANLAGADRLVTMSAVSLVNSLPINYGERISAVKGVQEVAGEDWVGGYFQDPRKPIFAMAVQAENYLDIHSEYLLPAAQKQVWLADKRGVIVGASLAKQYGWRLGQQLPLRSNIWRDNNGNNTWVVTVDGIFTTHQQGQDSLLLMHYDYLNDARAFVRDTVSFFILKIADPQQTGPVGQTVDALFANSPNETRTATEKAFAQSFAAQFGDIGAIVTAVVSAVLFTMLLVTANTMAQSVRERTNELAVLKTLGFSNQRIASMVLLESLLVTGIGGAIGLSLAYALIASLGFFAGALLEFLPGLYIPASSTLLGALLIIVLGILAGLLPATRAMRLQVVAALRGA
ncbi:MAG TPA: FtsX-like permease family protein [Gammaproteobacteria bacterium]|nr:FtsX-like permease family protein [Gammaproteobacteria bacterium]